MNDKQRVAEHAASLITDGMTVGLGTGSTANFFIEALARKITEDDLQIKVVSSSVVSSIKAEELGLNLLSLEHIRQLDVYVDGADEVSPDLTLLKGRGSDLVREKLLAIASTEFWVLIDESKRVERIGQNFAIPIEVMPFAWRLVQASLAKIGGTGKLRSNAAGDGLAVTAYGSLVLDTVFDASLSGSELNERINAIPGVVEHGIFSRLATAVFCGHEGRVQEQSI